MADNVAITSGSGTSIATDDIGGVHYQRVKAVWGPDGTANDTDVATGKPMPVQLRLSTGEALGVKEDTAAADGDGGIPIWMRRAATPGVTSGTDGDYEPLQGDGGALWTKGLGIPFTVAVDITRPADTTQYAVNDAISDSTSAPTSGGFTLSSIARKSGGSILITDVRVSSSNGPGTPLQVDVLLFNQAVTAINDNAAFAITAAEAKTIVAKFPATLAAIGGRSLAHLQNLSSVCLCVGTANLRLLLRALNTYTPASSEVITVTISGFQID